MSAFPSPIEYKVKILPELHRIQRKFGYLEEKSLNEASERLDVPLAQIQAVASYFPHFRVEKPKKIIVSMCRDMACHMNGAASILAELKARIQKSADLRDNVEIQGVSCLGRCDRPPAAYMHVARNEHESYFLGRTTDDLFDIIEKIHVGETPRPDLDSDQDYAGREFQINFYGKQPPDYKAVKKALSARDAALESASQFLATEKSFTPTMVDTFQKAVLARASADACKNVEVGKALTDWATASDWAKEYGGWSDAVLEDLKAGNLRGMGGAGLESMDKLRDIRKTIRTARLRKIDSRGFIVVNGDESEPGTFKDREILLNMPHLVVEAVILAGLVTEATQGFIYIRHEYGEQIKACEKEIERAEELGLCGPNAHVLGRPFPVSVFISPGGYICGEQSALIEAMSDHRGEPRNMPPKLETNGLANLPTIVSNVETYAWMPYLYYMGGAAYAALGQNGWRGRRFFSVSGDVKRPGVYEVPMGMQLRELIHGDDYCRGIVGDKPLKAFAPSGPSGGFLPPVLRTVPVRDPKERSPYVFPPENTERNKRNREAWEKFANRHKLDPNAASLDILDLDLELNLFRALSPSAQLGAGLIVYAEGRDIVDQAVNSMEFFRNESCGKCVPCRLGSQKVASLGAHLRANEIEAANWPEVESSVKEIFDALTVSSICALGRSVPMPLTMVANHFPDDLNQHLRHPQG